MKDKNVNNVVSCSRTCNVCSCSENVEKTQIEIDESFVARDSVPELKFTVQYVDKAVEFLNTLFQAFVTWLSGVPRTEEIPLFQRSTTFEILSMILTLLTGVVLSSSLLVYVSLPELAWFNILWALGWIYLFMLGLTLTVSGSRAALTTICHAATHYTLVYNKENDKKRMYNEFACEIISIVLLLQPFKLYRSDHVGKHHLWKTLCSLDDPDSYLVVKLLGFEPGFKSVKAYWAHFFIQILNPKIHWLFISTRLKTNFCDKRVALKRRFAAILFHASVLGALSSLSLYLQSLEPLIVWLISWVIPNTILFNISIIALQVGLHGWLSKKRENESLEEWQWRAIWNRHPISHFPKHLLGRIGWFFELLTFRLFERLFVLPSGLVTHGTHHLKPHNLDWPNEIYLSANFIRSGMKIRSFRGFIPSTNYNFKQLCSMAPLEEAAEAFDMRFELGLKHALMTA